MKPSTCTDLATLLKQDPEHARTLQRRLEEIAARGIRRRQELLAKLAAELRLCRAPDAGPPDGTRLRQAV